MSSEPIASCFRDILQASNFIAEWVKEAGSAQQAILKDVKARSAIERQFLVISEAATRLHKHDPTVGEQLAPDLDWPGIRGIGNFIRHRYDDLDTAILVDVIDNRLTTLRQACQRALDRLTSDPPESG
ncbi:MAG TPA: HepT-like ribonuclease domain-containing protein [Caulobacteraceae bacterium]|nr:HepT-like ribonuclease domain-containing protein [Caulobacteraceae bacterium]